MGEDLTAIRDKPEPDEKTIRWEAVRKFPDLAKQLAIRKHDLGRVELGWEIKNGLRVQKWLLSIVRPIGEELYHFTETFYLRKWKGESTARKFIDDANKYFKEVERDFKKKLN